MNQIITRETLRKFSQMSNAEAYVEAFHRRLMRPLPESYTTGEYWGSTSRADFYPCLRESLTELSLKKGIKVLDVGAGSGEMIDHVLRDFTAVISAVEPNPLMLRSYLEALNRHPKLKVNETYQGTIQSLYEGQPEEAWLKNLQHQDMVLASHMIYGLTSSTSKIDINPHEDLMTFLSAMYEKLDVDGILFIVYTVGENTVFGESAAHYLGQVNGIFERNVRQIWKVRADLLEHAGARIRLEERFPNYNCRFSTRRVDSSVYGDTVDDIASYCILGELTQIDGNPFDINRMRHHFEFLEVHGKEFNLRKVIGGNRDGMLTVSSPQVICKIKKCSKP